MTCSGECSDGTSFRECSLVWSYHFRGCMWGEGAACGEEGLHVGEGAACGGRGCMWGGGAACGGRGCMWGEGLHVLYSGKKLHQNICILHFFS